MVYNFKKWLAIIIITFSLLVTSITATVCFKSMEGALKEESTEKVQLTEKNTLMTLLADDNLIKEFIFPFLFILLLSFAVIYIISHLLSKPLYLAFHDSLTGLGNRAAFEEHLKKLLKKRDEKPVLIMLDLDNFKLVNDSFGHDEGDSFLIKAGQAIKESAGRNSVATRIGGDEFAVVLPSAEKTNIEEIALNMMANMERLLLSDDAIHMVEVTFSLGIAFAEAGDDVETLYKKADIALYESKNQGKNQYQIYAEKFSGSIRISEEALKFFRSNQNKQT